MFEDRGTGSKIVQLERIREGFLQNLKTSWFVHKLIFVIGLMLFTVVILSFLCKPAYEQGAWMGILAISNAFTGSLSFLFGITIPYGGASAAKNDDSTPMVKCPSCGHVFDVSKT
jgi:hypothetical protein